MADDEEDFATFEDKPGLSEDMKFLASMPELCDITFLVGDTREPVCAVKAVLAARSRIFHKILFGLQQQVTPALPRERSMKKRESIKEAKLKLFIKRSSEPNIHTHFIQAPVNAHQTLIVEEFEPDVFRQMIEYVHTGCVTLQARTLLGLMNAADYYGLDELRKACLGFVQCCITVDTVCALMSSAEKYIQYKCTKSLLQKVLEFVDLHGNEVLSLGSFALLPEHVVRLILSREELQADNMIKFQAVLNWGKRYCEMEPNSDLREIMIDFLEYIDFYKIPAGVLMQEVHPLRVVPDHVIMNALAYQADPASVDVRNIVSPICFRRPSQLRSLSIQGPITLPSSLLRMMDESADMKEADENKEGENAVEEKKGNITSRLTKSVRRKLYKRSKTLAGGSVSHS